MTIFRKWKHFVRETKLLHQLNKRRLSYKVKVVLHSFSPIFILVMMVFCQSMPYGSSLLNRFHVPFYFSTKKLFLRLFFCHIERRPRPLMCQRSSLCGGEWYPLIFALAHWDTVEGLVYQKPEDFTISIRKWMIEHEGFHFQTPTRYCKSIESLQRYLWMKCIAKQDKIYLKGIVWSLQKEGV